MTALQSSETWPAVPVAVNPDGAERVVVVVVVCSSSVSMAQEMIAKLKQEISNKCKILFIFYFTSNEWKYV